MQGGFLMSPKIPAAICATAICTWLLLAQPAPPPPVPWTAVGSTGAVDESALNIFAFTDACVGYRPATTGAVTGAIEIRYNVTNTYDNRTPPTIPGWTTLELGSMVTTGSQVEAILYKVEKCTGNQSEVCRARNTPSPLPTPAPVCKTCTFAANALDFANNLYYVKMTITRTTPNAQPRGCTLRIF
jgi:hypothetical protein